MIVTTNILAIPLAMGIWAIDAYLLLASVRLGLARCSAPWARRLCNSLREFTDGIPAALVQWVSTWRRRPPPSWAAWCVVLGGALVLRHLIVVVMIRWT